MKLMHILCWRNEWPKLLKKYFLFLNDLLRKAKPAALREFKNLESFAKRVDGIDQLQKWDSAFYSEKLKKEIFQFGSRNFKALFSIRECYSGGIYGSQ